MANITVTSTTNSIIADFGDYGIFIGRLRGVWRKNNVEAISLYNDRITVITLGGESFEVAHVETNGAFVIDAVDGVVPSSLTDLFTKLAALLG